MLFGVFMQPLAEQPRDAECHTQFVTGVVRSIRCTAMEIAWVLHPERPFLQIEADWVVVTAAIESLTKNVVQVSG